VHAKDEPEDFQRLHRAAFLSGAVEFTDCGLSSTIAAAMTFHVTADYPPPKTWQQFEELCADTYAADWADPTLQGLGFMVCGFPEGRNA
jgi:hypothetical protein